MGAVQHEHRPVLVEPVLRLLEPRPGQVILDGTIGLGGHAAALLPLIQPGGRYIGIDLDEELLAEARTRLAGSAEGALALYQANFADFPDVLTQAGLPSQVSHSVSGSTRTGRWPCWCSSPT